MSSRSGRRSTGRQGAIPVRTWPSFANRRDGLAEPRRVPDLRSYERTGSPYCLLFNLSTVRSVRQGAWYNSHLEKALGCSDMNGVRVWLGATHHHPLLRPSTCEQVSTCGSTSLRCGVPCSISIFPPTTRTQETEGRARFESLVESMDEIRSAIAVEVAADKARASGSGN